MPCAASVAVVDPETFAPQPLGRPGAIAISGPTVMQSYLRNPAADASSFFILSCAASAANEAHDDDWVKERFFLTGDVGELDSDGHLTIKGRTKEMIKRGGEQVSPYEVEEVLEAHPLVKKAVVFGVPSPTWGEEVGAAILLHAKPDDNDEFLLELRQFCTKEGIAPYKTPSVFTVVKDEDLPKTSTHKYIRTNLAEVLGVTVQEALPPRLGPPRVSRALSGIRFYLACQVMFNHIGASKSSDLGLAGWGAFGNARYICIHMPAFFALAGFGLAQSMGPAPVSKLKFFAARLSPMHPIYLVSLLFLLINLVIRCNPTTFDSNFHWNAQPDDATRATFCEPSPLIASYWGTLASTIVVYALGLQVHC